MWVLANLSTGEIVHWLACGRKYSIGRGGKAMDNDIEITGDASLSRDHAVIAISGGPDDIDLPSPWNPHDLSSRPKLTILDNSKYGTFLIPALPSTRPSYCIPYQIWPSANPIIPIASAPSSLLISDDHRITAPDKDKSKGTMDASRRAHELHEGDIIRIGTNHVKFRVLWVQFTIYLKMDKSATGMSLVSEIEQHAAKTGVHLVREFHASVTHMLVQRVNISAPCLRAMLLVKPFISVSWLKALQERTSSSVPIPKESVHAAVVLQPALIDLGIGPAGTVPLTTPQRKDLFRGKTFIFLCEASMKEYADIVRDGRAIVEDMSKQKFVPGQDDEVFVIRNKESYIVAPSDAALDKTMPEEEKQSVIYKRDYLQQRLGFMLIPSDWIIETILLSNLDRHFSQFRPPPDYNPSAAPSSSQQPIPSQSQQIPNIKQEFSSAPAVPQVKAEHGDDDVGMMSVKAEPNAVSASSPSKRKRSEALGRSSEGEVAGDHDDDDDDDVVELAPRIRVETIPLIKVPLGSSTSSSQQPQQQADSLFNGKRFRKVSAFARHVPDIIQCVESNALEEQRQTWLNEEQVEREREEERMHEEEVERLERSATGPAARKRAAGKR